MVCDVISSKHCLTSLKIVTKYNAIQAPSVQPAFIYFSRVPYLNLLTLGKREKKTTLAPSGTQTSGLRVVWSTTVPQPLPQFVPTSTIIGFKLGNNCMSSKMLKYGFSFWRCCPKVWRMLLLTFRREGDAEFQWENYDWQNCISFQSRLLSREPSKRPN